MKVKFVKNKRNGIWYSELDIYLDGKYSGFIYKCQKRIRIGKFSVVV